MGRECTQGVRCRRRTTPGVHPSRPVAGYRGGVAAYPKTYSMPASALEVLRDLGMTYADSRSQHDGYLSSWIERSRFERDGRRWVTVQARGEGYAAELAIDDFGDVVDVVPLAPDRARALEPA